VVTGQLDIANEFAKDLSGVYSAPTATTLDCTASSPPVSALSVSSMAVVVDLSGGININLVGSNSGEPVFSDAAAAVPSVSPHITGIPNISEETEGPLVSIASDYEFDIHHVRTVLERLKKKKAQDEGGMVAELYKEGGEEVAEQLTKLFNEVLRTGAPPEEWSRVVFVMIHKAGERWKVGNYRPVALLDIGYKIFAGALLEKHTKLLRESQAEEQAGFCRDASVVDNHVVLQTVLERHKDYGLQGMVAAVDFRKAFDTVLHTSIWRVLRQEGIPEEVIKVLMKTYGDQKGTVKGQKKEDAFGIFRGARQGDPLSPFFFNLILKDIFKRLKPIWLAKGYGVEQIDRMLTHICFADDVLLFGRTGGQLGEMLGDLAREAKKEGLEINWGKTWAMDMAGGKEKKLKVKEEGQEKWVELVSRLKYLGRWFQVGGDGDDALEERLQAGWRQFWAQKSVLLERRLGEGPKMEYLQKMVAPVILFGTESLELGPAQRDKIKSTRRQMMRMVRGCRYVGKSEEGSREEEELSYGEWLQGATRKLEEMVEDKGLKKWEEEAVRQKWRWAGHVLRRTGERPSTTAIHTLRENRVRAKAGNPCRRWAKSFEEVLGEDWQKEAQDREAWRFWTGEAVNFEAALYKEG
jgi:hypothetical protein